MYLHERPSWPSFIWDSHRIAGKLTAARFRQGALLGRMQSLGLPVRQTNTLDTLVRDVRESSQIEGEFLDKGQVRSSLAKRLGMDTSGLPTPDDQVEGVVDMVYDATHNFDHPLTEERLFRWQRSLFPDARSAMRGIRVGAWREDTTGLMQVVSGPMGREIVHYEAPSSDRLDAEMTAFLSWFNTADASDLVQKAGIAHLWFVMIHPFGDGNGRIARALTDLLLARSEGTPQRFYSLSSQILRDRKGYYAVLEAAGKGGLDVTSWLEWFLGALNAAFATTEHDLAMTLKRSSFWQDHSTVAFNERQTQVLNLLLDLFEGKLTSAKWSKLTKCSHDTALRDIQELVAAGVLTRDPGGGRSTSYSLAEPYA